MRGISLLEVVLVLAIISVVAAVAIPAYQESQRKAVVLEVMADMQQFSTAITKYYRFNRILPASLEDAADGAKLDPWGNPYQYLRIAGAAEEGRGGLGGVRKDKNLVPINTDYDLYSMGADGRSVSPLTAKFSRDDIIRANNGAFVGLAADY